MTKRSKQSQHFWGWRFFSEDGTQADQQAYRIVMKVRDELGKEGTILI